MPFKNNDQRRACFAKNDPNWDCDAWNAVTPKNIPKHPKKKLKESLHIGMKFNEWVAQRAEDASLIETQLDQWIDKLNGLLYNYPNETKLKLIEKVINKLRAN
jgi:hypothetical protein